MRFANRIQTWIWSRRLRSFETEYPLRETYPYVRGRAQLTVSLGIESTECLVDTGASRLVLPIDRFIGYFYMLDDEPIILSTAKSGVEVKAFPLKSPWRGTVGVRLGCFPIFRTADMLFSEDIEEGILGVRAFLDHYAFLFESEYFHVFARE